jgi:hypothetical protein
MTAGYSSRLGVIALSVLVLLAVQSDVSAGKIERWKHVNVGDELWTNTGGAGDGLLGFGEFMIYSGATFDQTGGRLGSVTNWGAPTASIGWSTGGSYKMSGSAVFITATDVVLGHAKSGSQVADWSLTDTASATLGGALDFRDGSANHLFLAGAAAFRAGSLRGLDRDGEYISFASGITASLATLTIGSRDRAYYEDLVSKGAIRVNGVKQASFSKFQVKGSTLSLIPLTTKLAITTVNGGSSPSAGAGFDVTVQVQDTNSAPVNVVADRVVTLQCKTGSGILGGTTNVTILAGTNSRKISGVIYTKAESGVVLSALCDGVGNGDSAGFTVSPGAPRKLVFSVQPGESVVSGWTVTPAVTVQIQDANGNNVASDARQVSLSCRTAAFPKDCILVAKAVDGLATFSELKPVGVAGSNILVASAGSLVSATSRCFAVSSEYRAHATPEKTVQFNAFKELAINTITPQGWLREFLVRQNSGLTGHREILSYPFDTCLWAGRIPYNGNGDDWWRYEQTAYLTDGMLRLGYLINDDKLIQTGRDGVAYVLAHPMDKGRLGHPFFASQWPMAVFFRAMQAEYSAGPDPKFLEALRQHYLSYSTADLKCGRNVINLEGMLWTYGKTGDRTLLDRANAIYDQGQGIWGRGALGASRKDVEHGVTYNEMAKLPAIFYAYTGNKEYLLAAVNAYKKLDRDHMLPDGVPSSNEFLAGKDIHQSHETCDISDYTWSVGYLLMASGEATWADHIEKAIFNAGPGCVSKDFRNLQYFSGVNQVIATGDSNHNKHFHGSTWMAYRPCHETECCAGNVHRFMPNYAARMWMSDTNGGLVATLYGPSSITVPINQGRQQLIVTQDTGYPFSETISFTFKTPIPVVMPFSFRIPGWCATPSVTVNQRLYEGPLTSGTFVTLNRTFRNGDIVTLRLPMPLKLIKWENQGVAVERGPLLFAYPVPEKVTDDTRTYGNMRGKKSSDPVNFPALDIRPDGPWNYALAVNSVADLKLVANENINYPFDPGVSPLVIKAPARRVKGWALVENRYTPPLPARDKVECEGRVETITLVPYGSTRLRIGVFPVAQ